MATLFAIFRQIISDFVVIKLTHIDLTDCLPRRGKEIGRQIDGLAFSCAPFTFMATCAKVLVIVIRLVCPRHFDHSRIGILLQFCLPAHLTSLFQH